MKTVTRKDKADPSPLYAHAHVAQETGHAVTDLVNAPAGAYIATKTSTWTKAAEGDYWLHKPNAMEAELVPAVPAMTDLNKAAGPGIEQGGVLNEEVAEELGLVEEEDGLPLIMVPAQPMVIHATSADKNTMPGECDCGGGEGNHMADCASLKPVVQDKQDRADHLHGRHRIDRMDTNWMTTPFTKTPEGYLKGRAVVTNIGVFTYRNATGVQAELRLPAEVFDVASLNSLKLKPLTNDHPPVNVTATNIKDHQVGTTGDNPSSDTNEYDYNGKSTKMADVTDGLHVAIDLTVQEAQAVADVEAGKVALSCGYTCDLEPAPPGAKFLGVPYDFIQRNIRYNHVALVDAARAGDEAKIRLDSADSDLGIQVMSVKFNKEEPMLKKVNLDGVDYEAEAKVIETLTQNKTRADAADAKVIELTTQVSTLSAERDTHKDKADALSKEVEVLKADAMDPAKLEATITAKLALRETARKMGVEKVDGVSDLDLKRAVILKVTPAAKLDGKDDTYIQARFDSSLELVVDAANAETVTLLGGGALPLESQDKNDGSRSASEQARDRHHSAQTNAWKTDRSDKGGK